MDIFSKKPEEVAEKLGITLLWSDRSTELFANINDYIGLQQIKNEMLRGLIQKAVDELEQAYIKIQEGAEKNKLSWDSRICIKCSWVLDMLLTRYLKNNDYLSKNEPRSLLKQTEIRALYRIIENIFGNIQRVWGTLAVGRDTNMIIVTLPYITQKKESQYDQIQFRYDTSLAICETRKKRALKQIDTLVEKIENQLHKLTDEKYKKHIWGILWWFQWLTKASRKIKISKTTAAVLKKYFPRIPSSLLYDQQEIEEYYTYFEWKLSILNKDYWCKFIFNTSGSYDEYYHVLIQPDRSMDKTELISK